MPCLLYHKKTAITYPPVTAPQNVFSSLLCSEQHYLLFTSWSTLGVTLLTLRASSSPVSILQLTSHSPVISQRMFDTDLCGIVLNVVMVPWSCYLARWPCSEWMWYLIVISHCFCEVSTVKPSDLEVVLNADSDRKDVKWSGSILVMCMPDEIEIFCTTMRLGLNWMLSWDWSISQLCSVTKVLKKEIKD